MSTPNPPPSGDASSPPPPSGASSPPPPESAPPSPSPAGAPSRPAAGSAPSAPVPASTPTQSVASAKRGRMIGLVAGWVVVTLIAGLVAIAVAVDDDGPVTDDAAASAGDGLGGGLFGTGRPDGSPALPGDTATPPPSEADAPPSAADAPMPDSGLEGLPEGAMLLFDDPDAGFTTVYPVDWIIERDGGTTIFSGRHGTEAYDVTFVVQVVLTAQAGGEYADAAAMYQVLRSQLQSAGGEVLGETQSEIALSVGPRPTSTFGAIFPRDPQQPMASPVMQMVVTVFARDASTLMAVIYTAPQELYDTYLDVASTMFTALDVIG